MNRRQLELRRRIVDAAEIVERQSGFAQWFRRIGFSERADRCQTFASVTALRAFDDARELWQVGK